MSDWVSFFDRQPAIGQTIYYYGAPLGVWRGRYDFRVEDPASPHIIHCDEMFGVADRMDAPWWQPYTGQPKPAAPVDPYPSDYPRR